MLCRVNRSYRRLFRIKLALIPNSYDVNQNQANVKWLAGGESWITVQIRLAGRYPSLPYCQKKTHFLTFLVTGFVRCVLLDMTRQKEMLWDVGLSIMVVKSPILDITTNSKWV